MLIQIMQSVTRRRKMALLNEKNEITIAKILSVLDNEDKAILSITTELGLSITDAVKILKEYNKKNAPSKTREMGHVNKWMMENLNATKKDVENYLLSKGLKASGARVYYPQLKFARECFLAWGNNPESAPATSTNTAEPTADEKEIKKALVEALEKKPTVRRAPVEKATEKAPVKKATVKKAAVKKTTAKKATVKKTPVKKATKTTKAAVK